jgi:hypothetical protein
MKLNQKMIVDGGWNGTNNQGRIMYIVEKTQVETKDEKKNKILTKEIFSFVVCNVGPGKFLIISKCVIFNVF